MGVDIQATARSCLLMPESFLTLCQFSVLGCRADAYSETFTLYSWLFTLRPPQEHLRTLQMSNVMHPEDHFSVCTNSTVPRGCHGHIYYVVLTIIPTGLDATLPSGLFLSYSLPPSSHYYSADMGLTERFLPQEDRFAALMLYGMIFCTCFNGEIEAASTRQGLHC